MFIKAVKKLNRSMFPIFREISVASGQLAVAVAGTGFFINDQGDFVSAAHVFHAPPAGSRFTYRGRLPDEGISAATITEIAKDEANDLFIGHVDIESDGYLTLRERLPKVGQSVCVAGYPLATLGSSPTGGLDAGGVRRYVQPSFVLDFARLMARVSSTATTTHQGFLVRDFGLYGMSGGPVVDVSGLVVGVQGAVTDPRSSTNGTQTISVQNAMVIQSGMFLRLAESHKIKLGTSIWRRLRRQMTRLKSITKEYVARAFRNRRQPQTI